MTAPRQVLVTMREFLESPHLAGPLLGGPSWASWRALLIAIMGEELSPRPNSTTFAS